MTVDPARLTAARRRWQEAQQPPQGSSKVARTNDPWAPNRGSLWTPFNDHVANNPDILEDPLADCTPLNCDCNGCISANGPVVSASVLTVGHGNELPARFRPVPFQDEEVADAIAAAEPVTGRVFADDEVAWRTLADVSDDPPGPLLLNMLEPAGPTLAYAAGGTGKGSTGAWMCVELQQAGLLPMIYDAERRPREWSRRVSGLGGDRGKVAYVAPEDLPRSHLGRPLWDIAPAIGVAAAGAGADLLIIDSVLPAIGLGEERLKSDAQAPYLYVAALDALGIPSLSFGHPPKGQPEGEAFGSFAWTAAMRLTWLGTRAEGDGRRVRWRPRKRNERGHIPGVLLTFEYGEDGRPCGVTREDDEQETRDWLLAALAPPNGPRSVADLADELLEQSEEHITDDVRQRVKERLSRSLRRMLHDDTVERQGPATGRGVRWALRFER